MYKIQGNFTIIASFKPSISLNIETTTIYRLRELIYKKYGEKRFALGCEIVAGCLRINNDDWTDEMVAYLCDVTRPEDFPITEEDEKILMQLFGLKKAEQLYNK